MDKVFTIETAESGGWATVKHFGVPVFDVAFSYIGKDADALAEAIIEYANDALEAEKFGDIA